MPGAKKQKNGESGGAEIKDEDLTGDQKAYVATVSVSMLLPNCPVTATDSLAFGALRPLLTIDLQEYSWSALGSPRSPPR